ncbi:MAG: hypothetical protein HYR63_24505 [Proteobacteria bacterium]|nr:hypothetical protein [Pseudomonadota bacterium]
MSVSLEAAFAEHQRGELVRAVRLYRSVIAAEPASADGWHLLGAAAVQLNLFGVGTASIRRATTLMPLNGVYAGNLGRAYEMAGELGIAEAVFRRALMLDAVSVQALEGLGRSAWRAGRGGEARSLARRLLVFRPDRAEAQTLRAHVELSQFAMREAAVAVQRALALDHGALQGADATLHALAGINAAELARITRDTLVRIVLNVGKRRRGKDPHYFWIIANVVGSMQFAGWADDEATESDRLFLYERSVGGFAAPPDTAERRLPTISQAGPCIAFVVAKLADDRHAPTRFVLNWVKWLVAGWSGCRCAVFVAHEAGVARFGELHRTWIGADRARFWYVDMSLPPLERDLRTLTAIDAVAPDLVFCWSDELPFEEVLYRRYPTVQFSQMMRKPLPSADVIVSLFDPGAVLRRWRAQGLPSADLDQVYRLRAVPVDRPPMRATRSRRDIGIDEKAFVIVSVSNRLSLELTETFVDMVFGHLALSARSLWLCIGALAFPSDRHNSSPLAARCRFIAYDRDLPGMFTACDAYANPPQRGGGLSVLWAMLAGLPVLTLDMAADGAGYVPEERRVVSLEAYRNALDRLAGDPSFRAQWGRRMQEVAIGLTESMRVVDDMQRIHAIAVQRFAKRHGGPAEG